MQLAGSKPAARLCSRTVQAAACRVNVAAAPERKLRDPREENVPGDFYVDSTCIDCDTCRWMAPDMYTRVNNQSAIHRQPQTQDERKRALQALLACPTFSIHARHKQAGELGAALDDMPMGVPGTSNVFHMGMASEGSYGCAAYLIRRPEGNVMVDSPRFDPKLLKRIKALGGVKYSFLTHKDDVANHDKWAAALGCTRILHRVECNSHQGTDQVEVKLEGEGPWKLPDGGEDIDLIPTPGHSEGHVVLHYKPDRVLFSGDHYGYSGWEDRGSMNRNFNWFSVDKQIDSLLALKPLDFLHVLPGHGRPMSFEDLAAKDAYIDLTAKAETEEGVQAGSAARVFEQAEAVNPFLYRAVVAEASSRGAHPA